MLWREERGGGGTVGEALSEERGRLGEGGE